MLFVRPFVHTLLLLTATLLVWLPAAQAAATPCSEAELGLLPACSQGEAEACTDGLRQLTDEGPLFCATVSGCASGVSDACIALANWVAKDEPLPRDLKPVLQLLQPACDAKGLPCPVLAAAEGRTGAAGTSGERIRRAADWRIRACKRQVDCVMLAAMWEEGKLPESLRTDVESTLQAMLASSHPDVRLVQQVWQRMQLREQQCTQGGREACEYLAKAAATRATLDGSDPEAAQLPPLQRGCAAGDCLLCDQLASRALTKGQPDGPALAVQARQTCNQSCQNQFNLLGKSPDAAMLERTSMLCRRAAHWLVEPEAGAVVPALALQVLLPPCQRSPLACTGLGWLALSTTLPADVAVSTTQTLQQACKKLTGQPGHAALCQLVAPLTKVPALRAACAAGDAAACDVLVRRHPDALTVDEARKLLQKGCESGNGGQCARLIWLAQMVGAWAVPADKLPGVVAAAQKGCDAGDGEACFLLGYRLAQQGKSAEALCKQASLQLDAPCRAEDNPRRGESCIVLAQVYGSGFCGDIADADLSRWAAQRACEYGEAAGCALAARHRSQEGEGLDVMRDVRNLVLRACTLGDAGSCLTLRKSPLGKSKDKSVRKQAAEEAAGLTAACKAGQTCACGR